MNEEGLSYEEVYLFLKDKFPRAEVEPLDSKFLVVNRDWFFTDWVPSFDRFCVQQRLKRKVNGRYEWVYIEDESNCNQAAKVAQFYFWLTHRNAKNRPTGFSVPMFHVWYTVGESPQGVEFETHLANCLVFHEAHKGMYLVGFEPQTSQEITFTLQERLSCTEVQSF